MVFIPDIQIGGKYLRLEDIMIIILVLSIVLNINSNRERLIFPQHKTFIFIIVLVLISIFWNQLIKKDTQVNNTVLMKEMLRMMKYYLLIFICLNIKLKRKEDINYILIIISIVICTVGIMQRFNILGVSELIKQIYRPEDIHHNLVSTYYLYSNSARIYTTFNNPNQYGSFLLILLISITSLKLKQKIENKIFVTTLILIIVNLILTQSRSNIIATAIWVFYFYIYLLRNNKMRVKYFVSVLIATILLVTVSELYNLLNFYDRSFDLYINRMNAIDNIVKIISTNPVFGNSVLHYDANMTAWDSEILIIISYTGLLGLAYYIYKIINKIKFKLKGLTDEEFISNSLIIILPIIAITKGAIFSIKFFPLYIILYYISFKQKDNND